MNKMIQHITVAGYLLSIMSVIIACIVGIFDPTTGLNIFIYATGIGWFCMIPPVITGICNGLDKYNETR